MSLTYTGGHSYQNAIHKAIFQHEIMIARSQDDTYQSDSSTGSNLDHSLVSAAAQTTHKQMSTGGPILLGKNADGTLNIQLPNGKVMIVDGSTFPELEPTEPQEPSSKPAMENGTTTTAPPTSTANITVDLLERNLPDSAGCVFHVLGRRVNLDRVDHDPTKNGNLYPLLRAWVTDDPYRYVPPVSRSDEYSNSDCPLPTTTTTVPYVAPTTRDVIGDLQKLPPTLDTLRHEYLVSSSKPATRSLRQQDAPVLQALRDRGIVLGPK